MISGKCTQKSVGISPPLPLPFLSPSSSSPPLPYGSGMHAPHQMVKTKKKKIKRKKEKEGKIGGGKRCLDPLLHAAPKQWSCEIVFHPLENGVWLIFRITFMFQQICKGGFTFSCSWRVNILLLVFSVHDPNPLLTGYLKEFENSVILWSTLDHNIL